MSLLMVAPMLVAFIMCMPLLIPLLFSREFLPIVQMTQLAALAMYLKVLTLPVGYLTLARGRSRSYFILESAYFVFFVLTSWLCLERWGLYGMGVALVAAHVFDLVMIHAYARWQLGYRVSRLVILYSLFQVSVGILAFAATWIEKPLTYWVSGSLLFVISAAFSLWLIKKKV